MKMPLFLAVIFCFISSFSSFAMNATSMPADGQGTSSGVQGTVGNTLQKKRESVVDGGFGGDSVADGKKVKKVILGTHNSATSGKMVWWQRPLAWLFNITSRCQSKTIEEQLLGGVRLFNLQVCLYNDEWHISHGLCIYEEKLFDILDQMKQYKGIVLQLYLDNNFFVGQNEEAFIELVDDVKRKYCSDDFIMHMAWIEGTDKYPHKTKRKLSIEEHYWTKTWADANAGSWLEKLPLPKSHAKKYNSIYKENCKTDYLMLDFYE